jgi:hypothetical protein
MGPVSPSPESRDRLSSIEIDSSPNKEETAVALARAPFTQKARRKRTRENAHGALPRKSRSAVSVNVSRQARPYQGNQYALMPFEMLNVAGVQKLAESRK